jgi:hypothetical protein
MHTFGEEYNDGSIHTVFPMQVTGNLKKGNAYALQCDIKGLRASLQIFMYNNQKKGDEVTLFLTALRGNDSSTMLR